MSLLNQMLNDLEKRQTTTEAGQALPKDVLHSSSAKKGPVLLWVLVGAVVAVGALVWSSQKKPDAHPPALQVAAVNAPKADQAPAKPEAVAAPKDQASAPAAPAASVATSTSEAKVKVMEEQAKPAKIAMADEKAPKDSTEELKRDKPAPKATADQAPSFKIVRPQQKSDNFFKQAISLIQQSRAKEAQDALRSAIDASPANYNARQLLAELLVGADRNAEAADLLREGLDISPGHSGFSLALARLQVAAGAKDEAISTLEQGMNSAGNDADYHAYYAALLQDKGRNAEAIQHYIIALRSNPSMPNWLIGVGISLQAENKLNDAAEAYQRAIDTGELSVEVAKFAEQQLNQILP